MALDLLALVIEPEARKIFIPGEVLGSLQAKRSAERMVVILLGRNCRRGVCGFAVAVVEDFGIAAVGGCCLRVGLSEGSIISSVVAVVEDV